MTGDNRTPMVDPDNPLAVEIQQEAAATYFSACKKMVDSLEALKAFDKSAVQAAIDASQTTRRRKLLEEAVERVYFVVIQREAMKLRQTEEFLEHYGVPVEVKTRLGSRHQR